MTEDTKDLLWALAMSTQVALGWGFTDAPPQYAVRDLETVSIDLEALRQNQNRLHVALTRRGYKMTKPAGTFYLWGQAPGGDFVAFAQALTKRGAFVMPETLFKRPANFQISLTGSADMIEARLPAFEATAK